MKDICLINPPLDRETSSPFPSSGVPLGIASLAAYLRQRGIDVAVLDAPVMGWDLAKTAQVALDGGARIVGVSCLTENRYSALKTLKTVKEMDPGVTTVIGGLHVFFLDRFFLEHYAFIDVVVRGEGEETLYELINSLKNKRPLDDILGISFRRDREILMNPPRPFIEDIENLPAPAYDLFPMKHYPLPPDLKTKVHQTSLITTSRGCPMGCKFCETTAVWGKKIRSTSAETLFSLVKQLYEEFTVDYIRFADDVFTFKEDKVIRFCELLIKYQLPIKFRLQARVDLINEKMLDALKKAGCDLIEYGVESGSDKVLKAVGKNITTQKVKEAARMTRKAGIALKYFLIVGSLEEGPKETWETFQLIKETRPDWIGINPLTIYPGTEVYQIAKKEGLIDDDLWLNYINPKTGNAPLYTKNYSDEEVIFLTQLGHVWTCRHSFERQKYPQTEQILAFLLPEWFAALLVKNNFIRKTAANIAGLFSSFLT
jgi:anaerobic magnesium-protoporphyrin IX monomethyl ester cyclase